MKKKLLLLSVFSLFILSCSKPAETQEIEEEKTETIIEEEVPARLPTGDNSQNALDWPGTYFATLPCASCEGIETWVTLNQDGTFELKTHHMGLNDDREEIFTGKFIWDETGSMVTLQGLIGGAPGKYKVGENQIWHLDHEGNRIEGDLADHYILKKKQP